VNNRRFVELWGIPEALIARRNDEELLAFACEQLVHPEQFIERVQSVYSNRDEFSSDILELKGGRVFARTSRPHRVRGVTMGLVWSFRDITARHRAEAARNEALEKERSARAEAESERLRAEILSEASRLLAESLDYDTTVKTILEFVVPKVGDWSGIGLSERPDTGMHLIGFRSNPPRPDIAERIEKSTILNSAAPEGIPRVIRSGRAVLYPEVTENDLCAEDGHWPIVGTRDPKALAGVRELGLHSFMIVPLPVRGKVIGAISIASASENLRFGPDDLRFAEELGRRCALALDNAMLYRDALRTIQVREDFLSVASHELRTPLSPLRMQFEMAHLFVKEMPDGFERRAELLEMMEGAGLQVDRLLRLVDSLLDVSRISAGQLKIHVDWFDLVGLLKEIGKRFEPSLKKAGCELRMDLPEELEGYWDASRIDQVVSNLLSNAMKFGAGHPVSIVLVARNGEAHLKVADQGPGVPLADQPHIFDRFERGKAPSGTHGFGLGLYICREIVAAHAGKVSLESEPGKGAAFTVRLPLRSRSDSEGLRP
jgi:signal transduction histidine kinase